MENFLKIKKRKFFIFLVLFFNQYLLEGYAFNYKEIDVVKSEKNKFERKFYNSSNIFLAEKNKDQINSIKQQKKEIENFAKEIEDFLEETIDLNYFEDFKNQKNNEPLKNDNVDVLKEESKSKENNESLKTDNVHELE